jgi:hypothetical protein
MKKAELIDNEQSSASLTSISMLRANGLQAQVGLLADRTVCGLARHTDR